MCRKKTIGELRESYREIKSHLSKQVKGAIGHDHEAAAEVERETEGPGVGAEAGAPSETSGLTALLHPVETTRSIATNSQC
mmetsp:Transcript_22497/g.45513  ORF Transcript_22497/g.45513 Transcript_22497/m.45513 type:complete len:81 (-) Transcript_22497:343-585(-)